jgi:hypothetical protein
VLDYVEGFYEGDTLKLKRHKGRDLRRSGSDGEREAHGVVGDRPKL